MAREIGMRGRTSIVLSESQRDRLERLCQGRRMSVCLPQRVSIGRILNEHGLKLQLAETFELSNDQAFVEKLRDVVGL